jgi:uracil-DNA glycosylase family 4
MGMARRVSALEALEQQIVACRRCPRLVAWRGQVARDKRAAFRDEVYWGRPVPGFGDPLARIVVVGLAPGAHGANRTGRVFTGDRSGEWLYRALHRAGLADRPRSTGRDDGLTLVGCWITLAVRCVPPENSPTGDERVNCLPYLVEELQALRSRVVVCLGKIAWDAVVRALAAPPPRPAFGHDKTARIGGFTLFGCYHPSQQNTFTGKLTEAMLDGVLARARRAADGGE